VDGGAITITITTWDLGTAADPHSHESWDRVQYSR